MFVLTKLSPVVLVVALAQAFAPSAHADGLGISIGKHGKHRSIGVQIGFGDFGRRSSRDAGRWETIREKVWVEGYTERVWVQAVYETRYDSCGRAYTVCVQPARWESVCVPGRYEWRERRVWVSSGWRRHCD